MTPTSPASEYLAGKSSPAVSTASTMNIPASYTNNDSASKPNTSSKPSEEVIGQTENSHSADFYPATIRLEETFPPVSLPSLENHSHTHDSVLPCQYNECFIHPKPLHITISRYEGTSEIRIDLQNDPQPASEAAIPFSVSGTSILASILPSHVHVTSLQTYTQTEERHERIPLSLPGYLAEISTSAVHDGSESRSSLF